MVNVFIISKIYYKFTNKINKGEENKKRNNGGMGLMGGSAS